MPFSEVCTFVDAMNFFSIEPRSKEDLITSPHICYDAFDPASLTPFPRACTFAHSVKTASGKHLFNAFYIYLTASPYQGHTPPSKILVQSCWRPFQGCGPLLIIFRLRPGNRTPKNNLLPSPRICFDVFDLASLKPFPGACTFADVVKNVSSKHLLEAFSISFTAIPFQCLAPLPMPLVPRFWHPF